MLETTTDTPEVRIEDESDGKNFGTRRYTARASSLGSLRTANLVPDFDISMRLSRNKIAISSHASRQTFEKSPGASVNLPSSNTNPKTELDKETQEEEEEEDELTELDALPKLHPAAARRQTVHDIHTDLALTRLPRRTSTSHAMRRRSLTPDGLWVIHDVALAKLTGRDQTGAFHTEHFWSRMVKALKQTEIEKQFDGETTEEFFRYYYKAYKRQWQLMDLLAMGIACFFVCQSIAINRIQLYDDSGLQACLLVLFAVPAAELLFSFSRHHEQHASRAHLVMLLLYGIALATMEIFMQSLNPPGYMFLFILLMYTDIGCQPYGAIGLIGFVVTSTDFAFMVMAIQSNPELQTECDASSSCLSKLCATALLYFASNIFGLTYAFMSWKYTRKTFLTHRLLTKNQQKLTEAGTQAENIALSILPAKVWRELRGGKHQRFDTGMENMMHKNIMYRCRDVTILFGDIVGFTNLSGSVTSTKLVGLLNEIFLAFDQYVEIYGCEKIKTIGDCYMVCSGVPEPVQDHELRAVAVGQKMVEVMQEISKKENHCLSMRIGLHTGDVMAGLIGEEKLIFDVWSKDVSIASYMEQSGKPSRVHISEKTRHRLGNRVVCSPGPTVTCYEATLNTFFVDEILEPPGPATAASSYDEGAKPAALRKGSAILSTAMLSPTEGGMKSERAMTENTSHNDFIENATKEAGMIATKKPEISLKSPIRWFDCRFEDDKIETEFQINFVAKCAGKFSVGVGMCIFATIINLCIDVVVFHDPWFWAPVVVVILIQFFVLVVSLSSLHKGVPANSLLRSFIDLNGMLNGQIMGPVAILLVYIGVLIGLAFVDKHLFQYIYSQIYLLLMVSTTFTRLRMVNIAGTSAFIVISFHLLATIYPELLANYQYMTVPYMGTIVMANVLVTRRMELYIRTNYLAKKDLVQKKYEIDDMRIKSERMLYKLLPKAVVERLKAAPNKEIADGVSQAGILFCTILNFKQIDPETMTILNDIISKFDRMLAVHEVEKVKTIGTTYMAASGLTPHFDALFGGMTITKPHYVHLANFALALRVRMNQLNQDYSTASLAKGGPPVNFKLRIGMDVGPVVAGVIGKSKFAYDIWGEHVNLASRMDSTGFENHIQVTERVYNLLKDEFVMEHRGTVDVKGKGEMLTWWLIDRK